MAEENFDQLMFDEPEDGGLEPTDLSVESEEEAEEEIQPVEEIAEEPVNALPVDVIEEAVGYGLTSKDIERLGSEENIAAVLEILDRQETSPSSDSSTLGSDDEDDFDPFDDGETESNDESKAVLELKSQVERLTRMMSDQKTKESDSEQLFDTLSSEYSDLFGDDADEASKGQQRNRDRVVTEMETIRAGYKAKGRKIPAQRRLMKQAINSIFGDHETKVQRKKFSDSVQKRQGQFISRVNARDNRKPKGSREEAIDSVKAFLVDKGYSDLSSTETFD